MYLHLFYVVPFHDMNKCYMLLTNQKYNTAHSSFDLFIANMPQYSHKQEFILEQKFTIWVTKIAKNQNSTFKFWQWHIWVHDWLSLLKIKIRVTFVHFGPSIVSKFQIWILVLTFCDTVLFTANLYSASDHCKSRRIAELFSVERKSLLVPWEFSLWSKKNSNSNC